MAAVPEARPRTAADEVAQLTPVLDDSTEALLADLRTTLGSLRRRTDADPLSNPIQLLALAIKEQVDAGALSLALIEQLIQRLSVEAFERRAERLRRCLGETDRAPTCSACGWLIHDLTRHGERAQTVSFEEFRRRIERPRFGVVFSAASHLRAGARTAAGAGRAGAGRHGSRSTARCRAPPSSPQPARPE